jgi:hypothetical protein
MVGFYFSCVELFGSVTRDIDDNSILCLVFPSKTANSNDMLHLNHLLKLKTLDVWNQAQHLFNREFKWDHIIKQSHKYLHFNITA